MARRKGDKREGLGGSGKNFPGRVNTCVGSLRTEGASVECRRKRTQEAGVAVTKGSVVLALNTRLRILLERLLEMVEGFKQGSDLLSFSFWNSSV